MRTLKSITTAIVVLLGLTAAAHAGDSDKAKATDAPKELKHQTLCPVMGGAIDSSAYTDIQGQRVYHCCPMCTAKLKADPDKYFKQAAADGILFENVQTSCPISGKELTEKKIYTDFEGRRVFFCSEECQTTFAKDPAMYLKKLDKNDDMKEMEHGDHSAHQH